MRTARFLALILLTAASAGFALQTQVDVTGRWEVSFETPMGTRNYVTVFTQQEQVIKVVMTTQQGTELKSEGTIKGSEIAWTVTVTGPMGEIPLAFKGKVEGEAMAGTVQISDMGEAEFKAKRIK